jgi:phage terminase large subunit-like protein
MKDLKADFQEKRIVYSGNPIDKWCLLNTEVKTDINGNIQPVKGSHRYRRIDGTIALLCAYKVLMDKKDAFIYLNDEEQ